MYILTHAPWNIGKILTQPHLWCSYIVVIQCCDNVVFVNIGSTLYDAVRSWYNDIIGRRYCANIGKIVVQQYIDVGSTTTERIVPMYLFANSTIIFKKKFTVTRNCLIYFFIYAYLGIIIGKFSVVANIKMQGIILWKQLHLHCLYWKLRHHLH